MVLDFITTKMSRYDGTGRTQPAIEVFDCVSGKTVAVVARLPFETKDAWVARAFDRADDNIARAA